jgi:type III restriction enzyme
VRALEASPEILTHERDVSAILAKLKAEFSTLEDFEREFPSLCFALATGVGKTRLMGASSPIYIGAQHQQFFVLAPNLTIYNKLITDFTRNTPKYVFKGIAEFAQQPPLIITGDNYDPDRCRGGRSAKRFRPRCAHQHLQYLEDQFRSAWWQGAAH